MVDVFPQLNIKMTLLVADSVISKTVFLLFFNNPKQPPPNRLKLATAQTGPWIIYWKATGLADRLKLYLSYYMQKMS